MKKIEPTPLSLAISRRLSQERIKAGISLDAMADFLGLSKGRVFEIFQGAKPITLQEFDAVCQKFHLNSSEVLSEVKGALIRDVVYGTGRPSI